MRVFLCLLLGLCPLLDGGEADPGGSDPLLPPVVYLPYEHLGEADPAGQKVFLPYERFLALIEALEGKDPEKEPQPPVGAVLDSYRLEATVGERSAAIALEGNATGLIEGWSAIDLPADLALSGFAAGEGSASLERTADGLRLHLPGRGEFSFTAESAAKVTRDEQGGRSLVLVLPPAAAGRVAVVIPEEEVEVELRPDLPAEVVAVAGGTRVEVLAGGHGRLVLAWQGRVAEQVGEPMLLADCNLGCVVGERGLRYRFAGTVSILRNAAAAIAVRLPAESQILSVEATELRSWEQDGDELTLRFKRPLEGECHLAIGFERKLPGFDDGAERELSLPMPAVIDAVRRTGYVALAEGEGTSLQVVAHPGISQVDPGQAGAAEAVAAYRYLAEPAAMTLVQRRLRSELRGELHQWVRLGREEDRIGVVLDLEVRKAGRFAFALRAPERWELLEFDGPGIDEVRGGDATVDGERSYEISLRSKLRGSARFLLRFRAPPSVPRDPTVAGGEIGLGIPRLVDARQVRGELLVSLPGSWAATTGEREGFAATRIDRVLRSPALAPLGFSLAENEEAALAFTFLGEPGELALHLAPRPRELDLQQHQLFTIGGGKVEGRCHWTGTVRYNALDELEIAAPADLDKHLVFQAADLVEQRVVGSDEGTSTWRLRFATVLGELRVSAEYTVDLATDLKPGVVAATTLRPFAVRGATRITHLFAIARSGSLEVPARSPGLEEVAPADLPPALQGGGVVAGFRGARPAPIDCELVRHDLVALADAGIPLVAYTAVHGEDRTVRLRGDCLVVSRGRPYLGLALPAGAKLLEVAIDGRQGRPSRREDGTLVVPLGGEGRSGPRRLAFLYEQPLDGERLGWRESVAFSLPELGVGPEDVKPLVVERSEVDLYLPERYRLSSASGDLQVRRGPSLWEEIVLDRERIASPRPGPVDDGGLTVPLSPVGIAHAFQRQGGGGELRVTMISETALGWLSLLAAFAGLVAVYCLRARQVAIAGLVLAVAVLVLGVTQPWSTVFIAAAAGIAAAVLVLAIRTAIAGWRRRRTIREALEIGPDPFLEEALAGGPATAPTTDDGGLQGVDETREPDPTGGAPADGEGAVDREESGERASDDEPPADSAPEEGSPGKDDDAAR